MKYNNNKREKSGCTNDCDTIFLFIKFNGKKKVINDEETRSFERKMLITSTTAVTWNILRLKTKNRHKNHVWTRCAHSGAKVAQSANTTKTDQVINKNQQYSDEKDEEWRRKKEYDRTNEKCDQIYISFVFSLFLCSVSPSNRRRKKKHWTAPDSGWAKII